MKNYLSVLELLNGSDQLARAVGRRLAVALAAIRTANPGVKIIADSEASYFLARHLLNEQGLTIEIRPASDVADWASPAVAFVDAVHRGETLKRLLDRHANCIAVFCCIDLRPSISKDTGKAAFVALLRLPFGATEATEDEGSRAECILEVDQVTHVPCPSANSETYALGTNPERAHFLQEHPHLLRYGIHLIGGRFHVVSDSTSELVKVHTERLINWVAAVVQEAVAKMALEPRPNTIVLFSREDSTIRAAVSAIADKLEQRFGEVYSAIIPAAPRNSREIFGSVTLENDLLANVQMAGRRPRLALLEPSRYLAVLLDDAAVTGRGLLTFLIRVAGARPEQRPAAVLAVPVITKLSPAEEQLYGSLLQSLGSPDRKSSLQFVFAPLFRLQVRSYDDLGATPAFKYLVSLESIQVGGARVGPLRVLSHDVQLGGVAEGLLGRDFLNHFRVTIDNARGVVELAPK